MKRKFTKTHGKITETFEIGLEDKWIYVHYERGSSETNACLLKNENKTNLEYISGFLKENNVSEAMIKEIKTFLNNEKHTAESRWKEFTNFLMRALSLHLVLGMILALVLFAGFRLGSIWDGKLNVFPLFTLLGVFTGLAIGGISAYGIVLKYMKPPQTHPAKEKKKKKTKINNKEPVQSYPVIDVTLDDVHKAIRAFSEDLPKGVYRTILVQEDHSIDFKQLAHILGGIPSKKYYMSRETYDLFEESEKKIPVEMDKVQKAVDQYMKEHQQYPMLKFDPARRVNYYQLIQEHLLESAPEIQFYITDCDGLVTHQKPKKSRNSYKD